MDITLIRLAADAVGTRTFNCNVDHPEEIGFEVWGDTGPATLDAARAAIRRIDLAGFRRVSWHSPAQGAGSQWSAYVVVDLSSYQAKPVDDATDAAQILEAARTKGTYWISAVSGKVLLASIPGIDLADPACRARLNRLRRLGLLDMSRCDMPATCPAEHRDLLRRSEFSDRGCDVHFVRV